VVILYQPYLEDGLPDDGEAANKVVGAIDVWVHAIAHCWPVVCELAVI